MGIWWSRGQQNDIYKSLIYNVLYIKLLKCTPKYTPNLGLEVKVE